MDRVKLSATQRRRLQQQLRQTADVRVYRRTLAVLEYASGRSVAQLAETLGVSRQSVYNWIEAYSKGRDPGALTDAARPGRPPLWTQERQVLLCRLLQSSPDQAGYFARSWTVPLLQLELQKETGLRFSDSSIRDQLHRQHFVWKRPRYMLLPDPEREKKTLSCTPSQEAVARGVVGRG